MTWRIARAAAETIRQSAAAALPREACGLLIGQRQEVLLAQPARNISPTPRTAFEIDPQALFGAQRAARAGGPALLGYFHSHPGGSAAPSATDAARAAPDGRLWIIVAGSTIGAYVAGETGLRGRFRPISLEIF